MLRRLVVVLALAAACDCQHARPDVNTEAAAEASELRSKLRASQNSVAQLKAKQQSSANAIADLQKQIQAVTALANKEGTGRPSEGNLQTTRRNLNIKNTQGSSECPCLNSSSVQIAHYPSYSGICDTHDLISDSHLYSNCSAADPPSWCRRSWCLVDPSVCGTNETECELIGKVAWADRAYTACRARPYRISSTPPHAYSYETCGYLDEFNPTDPTKVLSNKTLIATILSQFPIVWPASTSRCDSLCMC